MISRRQIIESQQAEFTERQVVGSSLSSRHQGDSKRNKMVRSNNSAQSAELSDKTHATSSSKAQWANTTNNKARPPFGDNQAINENYETGSPEELDLIDKCYQDYDDEYEIKQASSGRIGEQAMLMAANSRANNNIQEEEGEGEGEDYEDEEEDYRHFDPYSVYGEEDEEEDVWYSEERLFEVSVCLLVCGSVGFG